MVFPLKINLNNLKFLYTCAFSFYSISICISLLNISSVFISTFEIISSVFSLFAIFLLAFILLFEFLLKKCNFLFHLLCFSFSLILSIFAHYYVLFWLVSFAVLSEYADKHLLIDIVLLLSIVTLLVGTLLSIVFNFGGDISIRNGFLRYSFGLQHPNLVGSLLFTVALCICLKFSKSRLFLSVLSCVLISLFIYIFTNSRTSSSLTFLFVPCIVVYRFILSSKVNCKHLINLRIILFCVAVLFFIASFVVMTIYNSSNHYFDVINNNLSGRLYYLNYYWRNYPPQFFPQNLNNVATVNCFDGNTWISEGLILDNAYLMIIFRYGYIVIPFIIFLCLASIILSFKNKYISPQFEFDLIFVFPILIFGLLENTFLIPFFNIFCLYFFFELHN